MSVAAWRFGGWLSAVLRAGSLIALTTASALAASIASVSPQGEVAQVRQVTVRFSEAVVAFGEPRLPDPMTLTCTGQVPGGSARWASDRVWLYDFSAALSPGTRCTLVLRTDWRPLAGAQGAAGEITGSTRFTFGTGGPAVESIRPYEGAEIDEDQFFLLRLNGPAVAATVSSHAWCEVEGIGEKLATRVVTGAAREALLAARRVAPAEAANTLVVACQRPLPAGAALRLVWGKGIAAAADAQVLTRIEQVFRFRVRAAFSAEFSCRRERAEAPCMPIRPLSLRFSAPVSRELAKKVELRMADKGQVLAPVFDPSDTANEVSELRFPAPLPENTRFSLVLPPEVRDDAGRPLSNAGSFPLQVSTGEAPALAKFASAPFGVIERITDPVAGSGTTPLLPVTLRRVQDDLRPDSRGGQVRMKTLESDADIFAWHARLREYHETSMTARALGWPEKDWYVVERGSDAQGHPVERRYERSVATREVSLLAREGDARRLALPQLAEGDARPFEVIGIPLPGSGYHVIEIESSRLGQALLDPPAPMYVRTGVLVTGMGVHFKHGRENSVVWVTTLERGEPVEAAEVAIYDCRGKRLWRGKTDEQGLARVEQALPSDGAHCVSQEGLFVTARAAITADKGAGSAGIKAATDVAFVFSGWQKGFESWRFNVPTSQESAPDLRAHTVFDRQLLRAGETVSMKHFVRTETLAGLALLAAADLPTSVRIVHEGSGQAFSQPLQWNGARSASSHWVIPSSARLGTYRVSLLREGKDVGAPGASAHPQQWASGSFRVEAFRLPLVDARLSGPAAAVVAPGNLPMQLQLDYLSGGAVAQANARATAILQPRSPHFEGYDDFSFEPPRKDEATARDARLIADKLPLTTDRHGAASFTLDRLPAIERPSLATVEVSFDDPNGEVQTVSTRIPVWPSAVVLGVKPAGWTSNREQVGFTAIALDTSGKPIVGQAIEVRGRLARVLSSRKRMVGGFYAYDNRTEYRELGTLCRGKTDRHGQLPCQASLAVSGEVELIARASDAGGHAAQAAASVWVTGQGELWFAQDNDDRIDVLAERKHYEPGETARLQVRMPFREATVLVSVEREGVIATRVTTLRGNDPTIEVKIGKDWGPNVYVSVLALRGRIHATPWYSLFTWGWRAPLYWARSFWYEGREYRAPSATVDLARPAFRFGMAPLRIGVASHALQVSVSTDQPQYQVRQKVAARIRVLSGGKPAAAAEVAFAAVDESLLALRDNDSWKLLEAMLGQRAWGVETSTAQSEIIGRRHYGRKAVAAGGGGGHAATRELFDTLLVWKASVALDANGEAVVEVPLNDSLTRFRLVAIADAGAQRFGTGSTSVRVSQDLQLLSGLPPLVRDGDRFSASFTVRNTTTREMKVHASLQGTVRSTAGSPAATVAGAPATTAEAPAAAASIVLPAQELMVAAGGAKVLHWPVEVPAGASGIEWSASVEEQAGAGTGERADVRSGERASVGAGERASDRLRFTQRVVPAVPLRVLQASIEQLDGALRLPVAAPADALRSHGIPRGGVLVAAQPRLGSALPGLQRYFEDYPFSCLEQLASKAIGLRDQALWSRLGNALPTYLDRDGLANYFPARAEDGNQGSDRLTAYLLAVAQESGFALPAGVQAAMLDGLTAFVEGRIERRFWSPRADLDVRKLAALEALSRYARMQPRMLGSLRLTPGQWPTAAVIDWLNILHRVDGIPQRAARIGEAQQILRARLTWGGTTLRFSNENDDFWWWLMDSADANASRLILAVLDQPAWREELPRMVLGSLARQHNGAWINTTANLWGSLALEKFAARFEAVTPQGRTQLALGASSAAIDWTRQPEGATLQLPWPDAPAVLELTQRGGGRPWITVQSLAAVPLNAPLRAGYSVTRSVSAGYQQVPGHWSRGDVMRVRLEIDAQSDMTWVVVSDPVPGGATILGSGLGRDSALATRSETQQDSAWPAYQERSFEAYRSYYRFLPRGKHVVEYTIRLNNAGQFTLPPTRVEALYAPASFGEAPNPPLEVLP